jgi:hypothetical protein
MAALVVTDCSLLGIVLIVSRETFRPSPPTLAPHTRGATTPPRLHPRERARAPKPDGGSAEATGGRIYVLSLSPVFTLLVGVTLGGCAVTVCGRLSVFVERLGWPLS